MPGSITLYFDIVSPFAWLAFYHLTRSLPASATLNLTPIFLGGLMQMTHNTPPIRILNKGAWTEKERKRLAKKYNIPIAEYAPKNFPPNTLKAMRALAAVPEGKLRECVEALYRRIWVEGNADVQDEEVFGRILRGVLGDDEGKRVVERSKTEEIKELVKKNTQKAFDEGAFGLPYIVMEDDKGKRDAVWGFDHVDLVWEFFGEELKGKL
ncbi:HCCA isomerase/glutathione S-transferase kappa [Piedraia hortae CBS 480.64]|uniref:Glutathione S-transferase kappa n=1 Tax=Piedraia hortae CBS 480.64 TaxID=1314780 RepID=A0A6A7C0W5_9PEZI|nr:HCCA isomerase/glutathione S-transferase kappa [Piedraia hortae CBS 480.64]